MTDNSVFSSSINNYFEFIEPPIVTTVSPSIAPLGVTEVAIFIMGGTFDPQYEYYCQFKV